MMKVAWSPNVWILILLPIWSILKTGVIGQTAHEPYRGKFLNKFNSYHTRILGDVYIVDYHTIFIKGFTYDGKSPDAYFMVGSTLRPNNEGIVIANEEGKTNVLTQYINRDLTLKISKRINEISWLAVYDLFRLTTLADVSIPEGFEPPSSQTIRPITGISHGVSSGNVIIVDSKTLHIPEFSYDGSGSDVYFTVGTGVVPNDKGRKLPDENGYLSPLHAYSKQSILLEMPGNLTVFEVHWLSIWDVEIKQSYGFLKFPQDLTVPPALVNIIPHENRLSNCEQLHKNLQVSWDVFGRAVTIELAGMIGENDYMAFGLSGSTEQSQMVGADVSINYIDGWQGITKDYAISEKAPCTKTADANKGVCPDLQVGGLADLQFITHKREDNITIMTYRRDMISADPGDKNFTEADLLVVWAVGHLSLKKEPLYHYLYPKGNVKLNFGRKPAVKNCYYFATRMKTLDSIPRPRWDSLEIKNAAVTNFSATLGPSGGLMGYEALTGNPSQQLAWYINGLLAPEIYVKRNIKYTFLVEGGNDVFSSLYNNPLYISNDPDGGHERLTPLEQKRVRIYAGVNFDNPANPHPYASGRLCMWANRSLDLRLVDQFPTFKKFRQYLQFHCDAGNPGVMEWMPNKTTPDLVYYQSYKHPFMGWKIHVVDEFPAGATRQSINFVYIFIIIFLNLFKELYLE